MATKNKIDIDYKQIQTEILTALDALLAQPPGVLWPDREQRNQPEYAALNTWLALEQHFPEILRYEVLTSEFAPLFTDKILTLYQNQLDFIHQNPYTKPYFPRIGFYFDNLMKHRNSGNHNSYSPQVFAPKDQYHVLKRISADNLKYLFEINQFLVPDSIITHRTIFEYLDWPKLPIDIFNSTSHRFLTDALTYFSEHKSQDKNLMRQFILMEENIQETLLTRAKSERFVLDNDVAQLEQLLNNPKHKKQLNCEHYLSSLYQTAGMFESWESLSLLSKHFTLYKNVGEQRTMGSLNNYLLSNKSDSNNPDDVVFGEEKRQKFFSCLSPKQSELFKSLFYTSIVDCFIVAPTDFFHNNKSTFCNPEFFNHIHLYDPKMSYSNKDLNLKLSGVIGSNLVSRYQTERTQESIQGLERLKEVFPGSFVEDALTDTGVLMNVLLSKKTNIIDLALMEKLVELFPKSVNSLTKLKDLNIELEDANIKNGEFTYPAQTVLSAALLSHHTKTAVYLLNHVDDLNTLTVHSQKNEDGVSKNKKFDVVDFLDRFSIPVNHETLSAYIKKLDYSKIEVPDLLGAISHSTYIDTGRKQSEYILEVLQSVLLSVKPEQFDNFAKSYEEAKPYMAKQAHSFNKTNDFFKNIVSKIKGRGYNMYGKPTDDSNKIEAIVTQIGIIIEQAKLSRELGPVLNYETSHKQKQFKL